MIFQLLDGRGSDKIRPCNEDEDSLLYATYLEKLFPFAKFIFLIRDGRAVASELSKRGIFECKNAFQCFTNSFAPNAQDLYKVSILRYCQVFWPY